MRKGCAPFQVTRNGCAFRRCRPSWAVAYDKKGAPGTRSSGDPCASCGRSAFGVTGAGVEKGGGPSWPKEIVWSDGSRAGYGPEGGQGPQIVAFLELADAGCLYTSGRRWANSTW